MQKLDRSCYPVSDTLRSCQSNLPLQHRDWHGASSWQQQSAAWALHLLGQLAGGGQHDDARLAPTLWLLACDCWRQALHDGQYEGQRLAAPCPAAGAGSSAPPLMQHLTPSQLQAVLASCRSRPRLQVCWPCMQVTCRPKQTHLALPTTSKPSSVWSRVWAWMGNRVAIPFSSSLALDAAQILHRDILSTAAGVLTALQCQAACRCQL